MRIIPASGNSEINIIENVYSPCVSTIYEFGLVRCLIMSDRPSDILKLVKCVLNMLVKWMCKPMHKTNHMQTIEQISTWEVFSIICP